MMRRSKPGLRSFRWLMLSGLVLLLTGPACKTEDDPAAPDDARDITETDLFPFAVGRKLVYTEYALDSVQSRKVAGTEHRRTIHVESAPVRNGRQAFLLVDSIYAPDGSLEGTEPTYASVENGNLYLEFEEGWRLAFDRSKRTNTRYAVGTVIDSSLGFPVLVNVDATIRNPATVSTPAGDFMAYTLELVGRVTLGGTEVTSPRHYYFSPGVGIVRYVVPVTPDPQTGVNAPGSEMLLTEKSF